MKQNTKRLFGVLICLVLMLVLVMGFATPAFAMQIYVQIDTGAENLTLEVEASDSIENVKAKIEDKTEISTSRQTLYYGETVLDDSNTLYSYNITSLCTLRLVVAYPLWIGGTQVTSANAANIFNDGKAAYNAETATLTLDSYSYRGEGYGDAAIYIGDVGGKDFTISVSGTNSVESTTQYGYAIKSAGSGKVSIVGSGNGAALNLTVPSTYDNGYAVSVKGKEAVLKDLSMQISGYRGIVVNGNNTAGDALTIDKCAITFDGTDIDQAIFVYNEFGDGTISIKNGSNLSGKGAILCYGYGTASGDANVSIENSTVILSGCTSAPASGASRHAMELLSKCGDSTLTIDGSIVNVTASNGVLANGNGADGINVGTQETANGKGAAKVEIKNSSTVTATGCANGLNIFTWGDLTTNPCGTTLTVDSSTLTASATDDEGAYGIVAYAYKNGPTTVTFKDSNITASAKKTAGICLGAGENYNSNVGNLTLNSSNSTIITSGLYGLIVSAETGDGDHTASQTVSVTSGSFSSTGGVYVLGDDLDSSTLTFSGVDVMVDIHESDDVTEAIVTGKLNIDSGAYKFNVDTDNAQTVFDVVTGNITGGKYNVEPDANLIAENYAVFENTGADKATYPYAVQIVEPKITGADLVLDGTLTMRFYTFTPDGFDYSNAHMSLTVHGRTVDVPFSKAENSTAAATQGQKIFSCPVYSIEMAEPVTAVFHYKMGGTAKTATLTSSVKEYLDNAQEAYPSVEKLQALITALRNYGHYIQPYLARLHNFNIGTGGYAMMPAATSITPVDASALQKYQTEWISHNNAVLESVSYYDSFAESTTLHVVVKLKSAKTVTAKVGTNACEVTELGGNLYGIEIPNIAANNLGKDYTVAFSADGVEFCKIKVSALTYARVVMASGRDKQDEAVALTAFYNYYTAAEAYYLETTA